MSGPAPAPAPIKPKNTSRASTPAPAASPSKAVHATTPVKSGIVRGKMSQGERIGIYGPGGIGKTELCASLLEVGIDPLFIDLDGGSMGLEVGRATCGDDNHLARSFDEVRSVLQNRDITNEFGAVVIDTFSTLEERIREWVVANVPHEKRKPINSIEDYGFGKGYMHIFEAGLLVLQDLDALCRQGKHCVLICHQCAEKVPSAETEDYLEYQPRLQSPPKQGKLRERVFEWTNHFFRIDHDRAVEDGKAAVGDVRTIHTVRTTTAWAKHRTMPNGHEFEPTIPFQKVTYELWETMFGEQ